MNVKSFTVAAFTAVALPLAAGGVAHAAPSDLPPSPIVDGPGGVDVGNAVDVDKILSDIGDVNVPDGFAADDLG